MITDPIPNFPFKAYRAGPTGKVHTILIARHAGYDLKMFVTESGYFLSGHDLFLKETDAWEAGAANLAERQARITRQQVKLDKDRTAFAKARAK